MTKLSKINLIRKMAVCHLYFRDQSDIGNKLRPTELLELTEKHILDRFKNHFIKTAIHLNSKNSTYTVEIDSVESADNESARQSKLIHDMTEIEFINLISHNSHAGLILDDSKLEWIKKDRVTIYKITSILANTLIFLRHPDRRSNIASNHTKKIQSTLFGLSSDGNELLLHNGNLKRMNELSTDELYLSILIMLDNIQFSEGPLIRGKYINSIKGLYFEIDKLVEPLQDFIAEHPKSIQKTWTYLLDKRKGFGHGSLFSRFKINFKPDRATLEYLIIEIGYDNRGNSNHIQKINKLLRKSWSVMLTRKKSGKIKPITLSKKHYQKLQELAEASDVSEKQFIANLIDRELQ